LLMNSVYIKSAPFSLHTMRKGGSLTSSIGASSSGKSGSSMLPILGMNYSKIYNERAKIDRVFAPMNNPILKGLSPSLQLLYFVVLLFLFMFIGSFVASLVGVYGFGIPLATLSTIVSAPTVEYAHAMMWMNNVAQIFTFLLPVLV